MRLRTWIGCFLCAVLVVSAGALRLAPKVEAQNYPIVRTTAASGRFTAEGTNTLSTTAESLASSVATWECIVQNDPDNTVDFLVGDATAQTIQLAPGQSITIPIQDVSAIWADAVSGTPTANYLCR